MSLSLFSASTLGPILIGVVITLIVAMFIYACKESSRRRAVWLKLPTVEKYRRIPGSAAGKGLCCIHCRGTSFKNLGFRSASDPDRYFVCNQCGETLYRHTSAL